MKTLKVLFITILIFLVILIFLATRDAQRGADKITNTTPEDKLNAVTKEELNRGWYWGTRDEKKYKTPRNWIFTGSGENSCWHEPNTPCQF